jgi:YHS domain-containing protein/uncharacterized membrane protein
LVDGLVHHWLLILNTALAVFVGLPWLAPILMRFGNEGPARLIYLFYSTLCHQLPERSWFLFGRSFTYPLAEIERLSGTGAGFFTLRHFVGNPEMGWKLAWSDRMVSFYGGWLLFGLVYALARRHRPGWRGLRWQTAALLLLPMAIDGGTHALSDLWGIERGFREANSWLAAITGSLLPATFYGGDAWGSFNSLARLVTGLMAAAGAMLWLLPWLNKLLNQNAASPTPAQIGPEMPVKTVRPMYNPTNIPARRSVTMAKDPVCGMQVDEKKAAGKSEYQGQTYYFCSPGCKVAFDKEPGKYVAKGQAQGEHH